MIPLSNCRPYGAKASCPEACAFLTVSRYSTRPSSSIAFSKSCCRVMSQALRWPVRLNTEGCGNWLCSGRRRWAFPIMFASLTLTDRRTCAGRELADRTWRGADSGPHDPEEVTCFVNDKQHLHSNDGERRRYVTPLGPECSTLCTWP